jgi:uncharacterized protein (TIGR03435 family)
VIHQADLPTENSIRGGTFRAGTQIRNDSADFNFVTFAELIPYAYRVKDFQVVGPTYLKEARWNIQAKFPEGAADRVPDMMLALLTDRFKMTIHHEQREQPVYELVVAKGGPKMEQVESTAVEAPATPALPGLFGRLGGSPESGPGRGPDGAPPQGRGPGGPGGLGGGRGLTLAGANGSVRIAPSPDSCGLRLEFDKLSMGQLAETLTPFLDRPVLNSTELNGNFKAALNLPIEVLLLMVQNQIRGSGLEGLAGARGVGGRAGADAGGRGGRGGAAAALGGCDIAGALAGNDTNSSNAIFTAVQQLGLRLQPKKAPFDTIVVDRVEKQPTEN